MRNFAQCVQWFVLGSRVRCCVVARRGTRSHVTALRVRDHRELAVCVRRDQGRAPVQARLVGQGEEMRGGGGSRSRRKGKNHQRLKGHASTPFPNSHQRTFNSLWTSFRQRFNSCYLLLFGDEGACSNMWRKGYVSRI